MNNQTTSQDYAACRGQHTSPAAIIARSVLALLICVAAWLCVRTLLWTEHLSSSIQRLIQNITPPVLPGFPWQHPRLLFAFIVIAGLITIGAALIAVIYLAFLKMQRRALVVGVVVLVFLVIQWVVITTTALVSGIDVIQQVSKNLPP